ncbi:DUF4013 domain-containing protein [Methanobrevibacter sp.]|uniref:DUF4013 domain-containing protein n=1 Tax=Methanobrevibacter sp. TaxID=66852 RepID=UPI002E77BEB1|nr:DUF4013 domain-containing protein [Methanobrevibacter sp.]MEE1336505.1 DUF4013 domain-containing protein [Methanobrevibacter sp.]
MEITEIIKEAMIFPSTDLAKLAVYIVFMIIAGLLSIVGFIFFGIGLASNAAWIVVGIILFALGLVVGFLIMGYQISIIKSGIDHAETAPEFNWKGNLITGIKYFVVNIVYFIIPTIVVLIISWATNLFGMAYTIVSRMMLASMAAPANATIVITDVVPQSLIINFGTAFMITGIIAFILFVIFAIIQTMGQSRLANTDDLKVALNIPEAFRDIGRIGYGKVLAVIILIFVIIAVINVVITGLNSYIGGFSIISIIVTPYLIFFSARATGLLYSDIA